MGNQIQRLLPRHFRMVELCLIGQSRNDIAEELGMTPEGVGLVLSSPMFQEELARRRSEVEKRTNEEHASGVRRAQEILERAAPVAAQTHADLVEDEDEDPRVRQASANAILDRVYGKAGTNQSTGDRNITVIGDSALELLRRAMDESHESVEVESVSN